MKIRDKIARRRIIKVADYCEKQKGHEECIFYDKEHEICKLGEFKNGANVYPYEYKERV